MGLELLALLNTFENSTKYNAILILFRIANRSIGLLVMRGNNWQIFFIARIFEHTILRKLPQNYRQTKQIDCERNIEITVTIYKVKLTNITYIQYNQMSELFSQGNIQNLRNLCIVWMSGIRPKVWQNSCTKLQRGKTVKD